MKKIKAWLLACGVLLSAASFAQNGPPPVPERVARTMERLKPELSLTDKQVKDMEPVYTEFYTEMDKLRAGGERPSPEARQKLTDSRDVKLKKIISEEQFKKLKELEAQMRQQRQPNG